MRILIVGGGGREHALAWALRRERPEAVIYCAPGNPGTASLADNLPIPVSDIDRLVSAAAERAVDLVVVGPEGPLAAGIVDRLGEAGVDAFGPTAAAARLEASKAFSKEMMTRAGVPTARHRTFQRSAEARAYIRTHAEPLVVKASGLAAGKGAIVCATRAEAEDAVHAMLDEASFGAAGATVVVESFLEGEELSVLAVTDGAALELLPVSQDHKRLHEGDRGPNTGGMGAYSPVSIATPALLDRVRETVLAPTLHAMAREGAPYRGVLYAGLMVDGAGAPSVVEFNCRLGDPEAQVVLPLVTGGLVEAFHRVARGEAPSPIGVSRAASVTTVLAAEGYPAAPVKGDAITIPGDLPENVTVFHAGTRRDEAGRLTVAGGRVLNVTAVASSFAEAQRRSRLGADAVSFRGKHYRRDIGWREAARLQTA